MQLITALIAALGATVVTGLATPEEFETLDKRVGLNCKPHLHPYCCGSIDRIDALHVGVGIGCNKAPYTPEKHKHCPKKAVKACCSKTAVSPLGVLTICELPHV